MRIKAFFDLRLFVLAADLGSLSAAARALDTSPAVASAALKRLEAGLETRLLLRSTRSLRLTPEGERFLAHARDALSSLEQGGQALRGEHGELRGVLRLSAPSDFGRRYLLPWLDAFQCEHPRLQLRVQLSDRLTDVQRLPVDAALRYGLPPDSTLVALPLAPANRRVLCAAPAYLDRAGVPRTPHDLVGHNCLRFMLGDELHAQWRFTAADGAPHSVDVSGDRVSDDGDAVRRWALAGRGIGYKSWLDVAQDVADGRLRVLCPDWTGEPSPLHLICPDRRSLGIILQRLREFLLPRCAALAASAG